MLLGFFLKNRTVPISYHGKKDASLTFFSSGIEAQPAGAP